MNHLNIFNHYENKPHHFEDQLTRAFLILLKNIKTVQIMFLDYLRQEMILNNCEEIVPSIIEEQIEFDLIETQVSTSTKNKLLSQTGRLVSIIISDKRIEEEFVVSKSNREAVYDGYIELSTGWIFVIENKPSNKNIWIEQLSSSMKDESLIIEEKYISLKWSTIIERLNLLQLNNLASQNELLLINDFLEYINHYFPQLNPFTSFEVCKDNITLINKRCIDIMNDTDLGEVKYHRGWYNYININRVSIKEIAVFAAEESSSWAINLHMHPGDTMNQARAFYKNVDINKLILLQKKGWNIATNLHFSFRSSNLVWSEKNLDFKNYLSFWQERVLNEDLKQIKRNDFESYFLYLIENKMLLKEKMNEIQKKIINTRMNTLNICPGVSLFYKWSSELATEHDTRNKMSDSIKMKINEAYECWA